MQYPTLDKFPKPVLAGIDIQTAFIVSRLVIAAERLQLFRTLHGNSMNAKAVGRMLHIHPVYLDPYLSSLVSLGLLRQPKGRFTNTALADKYFVNKRSIYWTRQYSKECVENYQSLTVLEEALKSGKRPNAIRGLNHPDYLHRMQRDPGEAQDFTQMLFHHHQQTAKALAAYLDLSAHRALLDVGGGSGVMSLALVKANRHLRACILDIASVCKLAAQNIRKAGLSERIRVVPADIRKPLPPGHDVVMFCDIGPVSAPMLENAYRSLPRRGMVVLVDRYLNDSGLDPLDRLLAFFVTSGFGLATRKEMVQAVRSANFSSIRTAKIDRDTWVITGKKS